MQQKKSITGSAEIAADYKSNNVNVVSYLQLMTGYNGSVEDVYILTIVLQQCIESVFGLTYGYL